MPDTTGFGVIGAGTWGELHARTYASTPGARQVRSLMTTWYASTSDWSFAAMFTVPPK